MSRTSLHRPRRPRAVRHRPATDTRASSPVNLLSSNIKSCISTPTTSAAQRPYAYAFAAIYHRPVPCMEGPRTNHGLPSPRAPAKCAPHSPGAKVSPLQATPWSAASCRSLGPPRPFRTPPSQTLPASPNSRMSADSKPTHHFWIPPSSQPENFRLRTPVTGPRSHPLGWSSTSGGRDCPTARLPRVSSTSPQKLGAVAEPSPM